MSNYSTSIPFDLSKAFVGLDLSNGKRDQNIASNLWGRSAALSFKPGFPPITSSTSFTPSYTQPPSSNPIKDISDQTRQQVLLEQELTPLWLERARAAAELQADLSAKQLAQVFPYSAAARSFATAQDLAASKAYRTFAEGLPSNVQNIMASKQAQATSAAAGEADRARAIAAQQDAAKNYAGRFAGQYIQVG